ncbi:signaling threshold-regulating transmembrane adapter 1-like [Heterodontus francisci]|uniref:signaling threshold-regulating transmembrane adapter 1-like n=1 Tax=Heterodontus francisci TaxID=7792 RepID=UPI00355BB3B3
MEMVENNQTQHCYGLQDLCCSSLMWVICGASGFLLFLSLTCNILCCARSYRKDNSRKFLPRFRRSFSFKSNEVEDNPVYGNINYIYTGMERQSSGQLVESETGVKAVTQRQICYAKLELASSREQRGRKFTKTQYTEILDMLKGDGAEGKGKLVGPEIRADNTLSRTLPKAPTSQSLDLENSDLYASVRLGRREEKTQSEEYANKESLKI